MISTDLYNANDSNVLSMGPKKILICMECEYGEITPHYVNVCCLQSIYEDLPSIIFSNEEIYLIKAFGLLRPDYAIFLFICIIHKF